MNNSLKGALLSGLVIPGLGQIVFKHYLRGILMMVTVLAGLGAIVMKTVELGVIILTGMQKEGGAVTLTTITQAAAQASAGLAGPTFNLLFLALVVCWVIGVIDAYILGRKLDIEAGIVADRSS